MTDLLFNLRQRHYHYDALGQLTHIQQPQQVQYYAYDAHGRLTAARLGNEEAARQNWRFDAAGNPLPPPHAEQPSPHDWEETVRQRWQEPDFKVIQDGQASSNPQAHYWPDNRVRFSEHERFQFDARGNRTQSHNSQTGETKHYQYNSLNQLIQIDHYKANQQLERSHYLYDPLGRRLGKRVEYLQVAHEQSEDTLHTSQNAQPRETQLTETQPATIEYYGWDGDRLVFCNDQTHQWHYLYEPDSFTPILLIRQDSNPELSEAEQVIAQNMDMMQSMFEQMGSEAHSLRQQMRDKLIAQLKQMGIWEAAKLPQDYYFYHCNHLGLPDVLTDKTGQVVWAADYDPWGNLQTEHNPESLKQNIRLPGQYHDQETGLYYNRHRYYDPALGSYINQDPIGLASGEPNLTVYPRNPVQGMDPLGLYEDPRISMAQRAAGLGRKDHTVASREKYVLLEKARDNNTAIACYRPLSRTPATINYPSAEGISGVVAHQHIFFPDGTHIGYGPDGIIRKNESLEDYSNCVLLDTSKDEVMHKVGSFEEILFRADQYDFWPSGNNCQHFVKKVTR